MKERIRNIFRLLDENGISYYLLRPIDLNVDVEDLDIVVPEEELESLIELLLQHYFKLLFRKSHANASIQIVADDIVLDIKFAACFLPGKSLVLHEKISFVGIRELQKGLVVPDIPNEALFTFWTYHLFLDKKLPEHSSTFDTYKDLYKVDWRKCTDSKFFTIWSNIIFKNQSASAIKIVETYFLNDMVSGVQPEGDSLKSLLFKSRPFLRIKYIFDKIKYAAFRRLGIHGKFKKITRTTN